MAALGGKLQFGNSCLLVSFDPAHSQNPAYWRRNASYEVPADTAGKMGVVTIGMHGEQSIGPRGDRKSTRLNSSHVAISYAVFCLKKKKKQYINSYKHKTST